MRCSRQGLEGATYSDHGFVIIGMYFAPGRDAQEGSDYDSMCEDRERAGFNSGMGEIFRQVAAISPVEIGGPLVAPHSLPPRQLVAAARRHGSSTRGLERSELVQQLEGSLEARLWTYKPRALRAAASHLGLAVPPITTRAQKAGAILSLSAALREQPRPELALGDAGSGSGPRLTADAGHASTSAAAVSLTATAGHAPEPDTARPAASVAAVSTDAPGSAALSTSTTPASATGNESGENCSAS